MTYRRSSLGERIRPAGLPHFGHEYHKSPSRAHDGPVTRDTYEVLQVRSDAHQLVIRAAYRALAGLYHPDLDSRNTVGPIAELNDAYAKIRTADLRQGYDQLRGTAATAAANHGRAATRTTYAAGVLDFGRYEGSTITEIARHDPDYLKWLSRHSSGIRYRGAIEAATSRAKAPPSESQRIRGR